VNHEFKCGFKIVVQNGGNENHHENPQDMLLKIQVRTKDTSNVLHTLSFVLFHTRFMHTKTANVKISIHQLIHTGIAQENVLLLDNTISNQLTMEFLSSTGGSAMGFNNYSAMHNSLIPPQSTEWPYMYPGQDGTLPPQSQYMSSAVTTGNSGVVVPQPVSAPYAPFHPQSPYSTYPATMFTTAGSNNGEATSSNNATGGSSGANTVYYANSSPVSSSSPSMAGGNPNGQHDAVGYSKIEFNALVEEKILEEHNSSSNDNNNSGNGTINNSNESPTSSSTNGSMVSCSRE